MNFHRGWAIAAACFFASAIAVGGSQYSFGHFVEPLEDSFGWTRTQIGLSLSLIAFGSFISPLIGSLIDKHGSRKIMAFSMAVFGISYLVRPFMTELWHWYFLSVI
ncbi:MAG: MFS transporter, partial [Chloroflexota bacterium]|nr:MFS transporter [Chloroflexota bacterium]